MGEVRTKVKLINASDEALARRGQLPSEQSRATRRRRDGTGAVSLVLPAHVMEALGLMATGDRT